MATRWRLWAVCVYVVVFAGCGSSAPDTSVSPGPETRRPSLQTPDSALYCVVAGIATKSATLYAYALPDTLQDSADFHAFFDPQDLLDDAQGGNTPPADWTTPNEKTFISQLTTLVPVAKYNVAFTADPSRADVLGAQETVYYRYYQVAYGSVPPQFLAFGVADLYFHRVGINKDWKMVRWVDRRDTTATGLRTMGMQRLQIGSALP
jgi:hypothetical protein